MRMSSSVVPGSALSGNEYRVLTEHSPVMIWRSGTDALCDYFNATWLEFTGRRHEQELGNGWAEGVHAEDLSGCLSIYLSSFERRVPFEMRYRLRRHDGEYRYLLDRGVPFVDAHGQFAGFIGSCIDVQEAHDAQVSLKAQEQQALETSDAIQRRIGRDLHDGLGQLLTGIAFVAKEIEGAAVGVVKARAQRLIELIGRSVEHTQNLARGLAPLHLEHTSLETALQDLAQSISQDNEITCTLSCMPGMAIIDAGARTQLFLITQEAIANAIRHGDAKHIGIELTGDDRRHLLRIIDDGRGMQAPPPRSGLGLQSMAQRARLLGGALEVGPSAQGGVEVRCTW
jgi:PAS domain S-box-containing protein